MLGSKLCLSPSVAQIVLRAKLALRAYHGSRQATTCISGYSSASAHFWPFNKSGCHTEARGASNCSSWCWYLYSVRSDLCDLSRDLQVLHLQSYMYVPEVEAMPGPQLLHCLRHSASLRVLSLTQKMRVREYPMRHMCSSGRQPRPGRLQACACMSARAFLPCLTVLGCVVWDMAVMTMQSCTGPPSQITR